MSDAVKACSSLYNILPYILPFDLMPSQGRSGALPPTKMTKQGGTEEKEEMSPYPF